MNLRQWEAIVTKRRMIIAKLHEVMAIRNSFHDRIAWENYTRTREYMRAYRRQWVLEGPR